MSFTGNPGTAKTTVDLRMAALTSPPGGQRRPLELVADDLHLRADA